MVLTNRKQDPNKTLNKYLQSLKLLCQDSNFHVQSSEEYTNDHIKDFMVNSIDSSYI